MTNFSWLNYIQLMISMYCDYNITLYILQTDKYF